jgi:competence ComEA-like helix-hairpin-helix protein
MRTPEPRTDICRRGIRKRGIALITAVWMLAVLVVLLAGFAAVVFSDSQAATNFGQLSRARWAARTGICRAEARLIADAQQPFTALEATGRLLLEPEDETLRDMGVVPYRTIVEDEAGKININTADAETLAAIFEADVADAIIDWRDEDSEMQPLGAEAEYYTALIPPYTCKNTPFTTVRELLLVKGVTKETLARRALEDGRTVEDLLTVSSLDANLDKERQARVNIATAAKDALTQAFSDDLTAQEIDAIIAQRGSTPFKAAADVLQTPNLARAKVARIFDRITATADTVRKGLVNINTAPAEVLQTLPGMDEAAARAIVQRRETEGPYEDLGQLLEDEGMSVEVFRRVAELLTTRSRTFRVVSTGRDAGGVQATVTCLLGVEMPEAEAPATAPATVSPAATIRTLYWRE